MKYFGFKWQFGIVAYFQRYAMWRIVVAGGRIFAINANQTKLYFIFVRILNHENADGVWPFKSERIKIALSKKKEFISNASHSKSQQLVPTNRTISPEHWLRYQFIGNQWMPYRLDYKSNAFAGVVVEDLRANQSMRRKPITIVWIKSATHMVMQSFFVALKSLADVKQWFSTGIEYISIAKSAAKCNLGGIWDGPFDSNSTA